MGQSDGGRGVTGDGKAVALESTTTGTSSGANAPYIGMRLGSRYELTELLAQGAVCAVYRGHDDILQRPIVVKVVPPTSSDAWRQALRQTATLAHPATITPYDAYTRDDELFLIQEYVAARPLSLYLRGGAPALRAVDLAGQIARAIAYAHGRGIAHGDLTPAAVLVDRHAIARINNFSLPPDEAYFTAMARAVAFSTDSENSAGDDGGNFWRVSALERDVWAVGLLLWQLLTAIGADERRTFRADVPESLRELTLRCIVPAHAQAIRDADELAIALEDEAQLLALARPPTPSLTPPAVRAARETVQRTLAWSGAETVASQRVQHMAEAPTSPSATLVAPTDPLSLRANVAARGTAVDTGATRPASDYADFGGIGAPRLRLPSRSLTEVDSADATVHADPGVGYAQYGQVAAGNQQSGRGLSLMAWFVICVILFAICFAIGYIAPLPAFFK